MSDSEHDDHPTIEIQRQTAFTASGELEVSEEAVETTLVDFGADIDTASGPPVSTSPKLHASASTTGQR